MKLAAEEITRATAGLGVLSHDDYLIRCRQDRLILYGDVDNANIFTNSWSNIYHQSNEAGVKMMLVETNSLVERETDSKKTLSRKKMHLNLFEKIVDRSHTWTWS